MEVDEVPQKSADIPTDNTESKPQQNAMPSEDFPDVLSATEFDDKLTAGNDMQSSSEDETNSAVFDVIADFHKSLDNKEGLELSRLSDEPERVEDILDEIDSSVTVSPTVDPDKKLAEVNAAIIEDLCNLKAMESNVMTEVALNAIETRQIENESAADANPLEDVDMSQNSDINNDDSADSPNINTSPTKDDVANESSDKQVDDRIGDKSKAKMDEDLADVVEPEASNAEESVVLEKIEQKINEVSTQSEQKRDEDSTPLEENEPKVDFEMKKRKKIDTESATNSENMDETEQLSEIAEKCEDKDLENTKEVENEGFISEEMVRDADVGIVDNDDGEEMETEMVLTNNAASSKDSTDCSVEYNDQKDKVVTDIDGKCSVKNDNQQDKAISDMDKTVKQQDKAEKTVNQHVIEIEGTTKTIEQVEEKAIEEKDESVDDDKKVDSHGNAKKESTETDASNGENPTKNQLVVADGEQTADHTDIENNDLLEEMDDAPRSNEAADNSSEEADNVDEDDSFSRTSSGGGELHSGDASNENSKDVYDESPKDDPPSIENESTTDDLNADDNAMEFVDAKESPKAEATTVGSNDGEPVEESSTVTTNSDGDSEIEKEKVTGKHKADEDLTEEPPLKKKCENIVTTENEVPIVDDMTENSLTINETAADDMDIEEIDSAINTAPHIPSDDLVPETDATGNDAHADKTKTETKAKRCSSPILNETVKKAKICETKKDTNVVQIPETKTVIPEELSDEKPTSRKPVKQLDLKPEPKPMKDRQMQLCHEFLSKFKRNIYEMTRDDLENFVLHKCAEVICFKSNAAELNKKLEQHEMALQTFRTRYNELAKQYRDLEMVHNRVVKDLEQKNSTIVTPVKITRAVGLQVCLTRKEVPATPPPTPKAVTPNLPTLAPQVNQPSPQQPQTTTPNLGPVKRGGRQIVQNKQSAQLARSPNVMGAQQQIANQQIQSLQQKTAQHQQMMQAKMNSVGSGQQQQQNRPVPTLTTVQVGCVFVIYLSYGIA